MDGVAKWATVIILCAVICLVIEMLLPSGKLEKSVRFVLSAFMICAIIFPFGEMAFGLQVELSRIEVPSDEYEEFEDSIDDTSIGLAKISISNLISERLKEIDVSAEKIEVNMDSVDKDSISIIEAIIYVSKEYKDNVLLIKSTIEKELEVNCEVVVTEV